MDTYYNGIFVPKTKEVVYAVINRQAASPDSPFPNIHRTSPYFASLYQSPRETQVSTPTSQVKPPSSKLSSLIKVTSPLVQLGSPGQGISFRFKGATSKPEGVRQCRKYEGKGKRKRKKSAQTDNTINKISRLPDSRPLWGSA